MNVHFPLCWPFVILFMFAAECNSCWQRHCKSLFTKDFMKLGSEFKIGVPSVCFRDKQCISCRRLESQMSFNCVVICILCFHPVNRKGQMLNRLCIYVSKLITWNDISKAMLSHILRSEDFNCCSQFIRKLPSKISVFWFSALNLLTFLQILVFVLFRILPQTWLWFPERAVRWSGRTGSRKREKRLKRRNGNWQGPG